MNFMPMAFEVFGTWSDETIKLFKYLVNRASEVNGIHKSILHTYWATRLSTSLMKYNSQTIINKCANIHRFTTLQLNRTNATLLISFKIIITLLNSLDIIIYYHAFYKNLS